MNQGVYVLIMLPNSHIVTVFLYSSKFCILPFLFSDVSYVSVYPVMMIIDYSPTPSSGQSMLLAVEEEGSQDNGHTKEWAFTAGEVSWI